MTNNHLAYYGVPVWLLIFLCFPITKFVRSFVERLAATIAQIVSPKSLLIRLEEKFISLAQSCNNSRHLHQIHAQVIVHGLHHSQYVVPKLISVSAELRNMRYGRCLFDQMFDPHDVSFNVMFKGYNQNGQYKDVVSLFQKMVELEVKPSCYTFPMVLKSCGKLSALCEGQQVHSVVTKNGFKINPYVGNTLIEMYSGAGESGNAYKVFCEMSVRNIFAWTSMINGFILCGHIVAARELFDLAPEKDVILWNIIVSGYIDSGDLETAYKLFQEMPHKDTMSWNTMLCGYATNGQIEGCEKLFEEMPLKNVFSWNGFISAYAHASRFFDVLKTFQRMLSESNVLPNDATLVTVLSSCARLGAFELGKCLHGYAHRTGYGKNIFVENALIDMYAKCGEIESSIYVFNTMLRKDLISWNTMIGGLAMHGHAPDALTFFSEMKVAGVKPDGITFIGVLCACTHMGLIDNGVAFFQSMVGFSISPQIEHYGCLVDLYARGGRFCEALNVVDTMPMVPDAVVWTSLLGASSIYKNVEVAELALYHLIQLEPGNPANYLMLSNIYGKAGEWEAVSRLKIAMRRTGFKNAPGFSMIEVRDKVVKFHSLDERLPETEEIYLCLRGLYKLIQSPCQLEDLQLKSNDEAMLVQL